ncbi:unnamed protein product [Brassica rapa]|uniref:Major facilitator superfamily (MFS) profile domain-containing protein n=1 Tax=Brassica campestris TaxID=3711 RepID=A0A8D9LY02_BRACM|nr:unnamed protein product [Brassica rapa]
MEEGNPSFTVDEALVGIGFGKFQLFVLAYAGMAWVAEAMEMMLLSFVGPAVQSLWNLSAREESLITSVVFAGMLIGAYSWGIVADKHGRRKGFIITAVVTFLAGFLSSFAPNYMSLIVLRCLVGLGLGGGPVLVSWYLEFIPAPNRGTWMIVFSAFWTVGTIFEASLAWLIMPSLGWRWLLALSSVPSSLLLVFYRWTPESPRYLILQGRKAEAQSILQKIARMNGTHLPKGVLRSEIEEKNKSLPTENTHLLKPEEESKIVVADNNGQSFILLTLLSPELIKRTLLLWVVFFGNAFAYYGVVLLTTELNNSQNSCHPTGEVLQHSSNDVNYKDVFIASFAEFPGLLISAAMVDRLGRKATMSSTLFLCCIFLLPLLTHQPPAITTALLFGGRVCVSAAFAVVYIYAPEIYPTAVRTTGVGVASSVGRIGGVLCPLVAVGLVHGCHQTVAVLLFEVVMFVSGICVCLFPFETSGHPYSPPPRAFRSDFMATTPPSHATDLLITSEEQPVNLDIMKEQSVAANNETSASFNKSSQEPAVVVHPAKVAPLSAPYGLSGDFAGHLPSSILSPQAQGFYYRGYETPTGEWDEYSSYVNVEGLDINSPVGFNENASMVYQTGYGYNPQMPYGPYSPAATPLPSEAQLYSPQQFPFSGASPYYQQVVPPSMQYISSPTQPELTSLVAVDQQGDNMTRPSYQPHPIGPFNGNQTNLGFPEWQQGFDGGIWSDWSKPSDMHRHSSSFSPALSPQPLGSFGSYGHNIPMGSQRQRPFYGRGQGSNYGSRLNSYVGMGNQSWIGVDSTRGRGRVTDPSLGGGYNGNYDILNEQNRGPRALKPKTQVSEELDSSADSKKHNKDSPKEESNNNNNPEFVTDYSEAKLFIIKSYSEDNVHKSIKYNVWASTPNGNKKLDAAYREAKEEKEACPVFLLFSVNASSQFCGVAEMIGPVDFEKSVDYWQQDKWNGQFPVKWHIIKDVPNSQFRHIILENNDNKPVTNSRDTQEVKLEQGIEMLKIFKNYDAETSILDDFGFYEEREKIIQERKARRQPNLPSAGGGENEHKPASAALQTEFIKNMSKSFAQVVRLDEGSKASPDATTTTVAVSSGQSN